MSHRNGAAAESIPELSREVDLAMLVRYAGASGDFNPIHFDDDFARDAGLDGVIGHGMLAMALVSQCVTDWLGDSGLLASLSVRFRNSFRPGDRLTVSGEVVERGIGEDGRAWSDIHIRCVRQDGVEIIGSAQARAVSRLEVHSIDG